MSAILASPTRRRSFWGRVWEVASDLLIATALIWTLPLLLGAVAALVGLIMRPT